MSIYDFLAPGFGKGLQSFLNPGDAYKKANDQTENYYNQANGFLNPYAANGTGQFDRLNGQANALGDPAALEAQWTNGYSESPYAQQLTKQATSSGLDAASSMGLNGSSAALNNVQQSASNIMQSDRQSYLNDLMQKYMASVGIGQNIYGVGAQAAGMQSGNALQQGQNAGWAAYNEQAAPGALFGKLAGGAADLGINFATGGASGAASSASNLFGNPTQKVA